MSDTNSSTTLISTTTHPIPLRSTICKTNGCIRAAAKTHTFCRHCLREMADIIVLPQTPPEDWKYEYIATCCACARDVLGLMLTHHTAALLRAAGLRCGFCRCGIMQIEELSGQAVKVA